MQISYKEFSFITRQSTSERAASSEIMQKLCRPLFDDQSSDKGNSVNVTELKGKPIKLAFSHIELCS